MIDGVKTERILNVYNETCSDEIMIAGVVALCISIRNSTDKNEAVTIAYNTGDVQSIGDFHGSLLMIRELLGVLNEAAMITLAGAARIIDMQTSPEMYGLAMEMNVQGERIVPLIQAELIQLFGPAKDCDQMKVNDLIQKNRLYALATSTSIH